MESAVLFVNDNNVLRSLKRLFLGEPLEVLTAGSGKGGLEILKNKEVGVIVSDQKMPEMLVSKDVRTGTGLLLLTKGAILDEKRINIIQRYYHIDPPQSGVYVRVDKGRLQESTI